MEKKLLSGRYRLLEMIDSGGSSNIYKALDTKTGEVIAAKVLKQELEMNATAVQRFKKEAQAALRLKHANIIKTRDSGADGTTRYIIMDFIDGRTLKNIIAINEPLPLQYVVDLVKKICLALQYAHTKDLVHRDVKPHNIMVDTQGEPYITDFGIAEKTGADQPAGDREEIMGSVHYISPEQARGEKTDKRSDIYSLGVVLYEILTGNVPFDGDTSVEIALQHVNQPMPALPKSTIPQSLSRIIQRATQKDKALRYTSASAMYKDLSRCLAEPDGAYVRLPNVFRKPSKIQDTHKRAMVGMRGILIGSLAIAAFIVILLVVFNVNYVKTIARVTVPDLSGYTSQEAETAIAERNLVPKLSNEFSETVVSGVVIRQDPAGGTKVYEGATINIYVSVGPDLPHMPNVVGMSEEDAVNLLKEIGLSDVTVIEHSEGNGEYGTIIEQVPAENDTFTAQDKVTLTVKTQPEALTQKAPSVANIDLSQALTTLKELGFTQFFVYEEQDQNKPGGTITGQNPAQGVSQSVGLPFTMWIAEYPNVYLLSKTLQLETEDDDSLVTIALKTKVDGTEVYFILKEMKMSAGTQRLDLSSEIGLPVEKSEFEAQLVVFINGFSVQSNDVTVKSGG